MPEGGREEEKKILSPLLLVWQGGNESGIKDPNDGKRCVIYLEEDNKENWVENS